MPDRTTTQRTPNQILAERMHFIACAVPVLFLVLWLVWLSPFDDLLDRRGTPLGADYAMFHVAGQAVLDGAGERLYDQAEHQQRLQTLFPGLADRFCLPFRYPPVVAMVLAPLAALPYAASYASFLLLSATAWAVAVLLATRDLALAQGPWRKTMLWALAGWPVLWETFIGGQASTFAALILAGTLALLRRERFTLAGAILALAAYKPNVLMLVALGLLLRYPKLLRGVIPGTGLLAALSLLPGGWPALREYLDLGLSLTTQPWDVETPFWKLHSLAGWLAAIPGCRARIWSLGLGLAAVAAIVCGWRKAREPYPTACPFAVPLLITVNAACNPYTPIYDLLLLFLAVLLTAEALSARFGSDLSGRVGLAECLLAALYFAPHLSQSVAQDVGFQPFTLVLLALGMWQTRHFLQHFPRITLPQSAACALGGELTSR